MTSPTAAYDTYETLRREVVALGPRTPGMKLPGGLRAQLSRASFELREAGKQWVEIGPILGISTGMAQRLASDALRPGSSKTSATNSSKTTPHAPSASSKATKPVPLRPVEIEEPPPKPELHTSSAPTFRRVRLIAPNGWALEIDDMDQAIVLFEKWSLR